MANNQSKLVGGKAYRLTVEGVVPIELAAMPPDQLVAAITSGFQVGLGIIGTITNFNVELLQQKIPQ